VLNPVVIGGFAIGIARGENTSLTAVDIARIYFEGLDSAEFLADAIAGWPTLPTRVVPGQVLPLGVRLTPASGSQPGVRRTTLVIVTTTGDTLRIRVRGEAGVQQLVVTPTSLFEDVNIPVGSLARRLVTITNNGTLPVRLTSVTITGPDSINYRMGPLPRRDLDPGQSEFLEITFAPVLTGQSSAQLEIAHTGGPTEVVQLGGVANRVRRDPVDPVGDTRINDVLPTPGDIRRTEQPTLR
jgi:hypothetical protein